MTSSVTLRFPEEYLKGLPFVTFIPKEYNFTTITNKTATVVDKSEKPKIKAVQPVSLYLPGDFQEKYGSKWGSLELIGGVTGDVLSGALNMAAKAVSEGAGENLSSTAAAHSGTVRAPLDMNVYQGPDYVSLSFSFDLIPVNEKEAKTISNIVKSFKLSQFPFAGSKPDDETITMQYPPIWDIIIKGAKGIGFNEGDEKKFPNLALISVDISYPTGSSNLMVFHDGMPIQTKINLSFQAIGKYFSKDVS